MPCFIFFTVVYISNSFVLGAVFSVIRVSVLSISYLPPVLALGMSLLLASETTLNLDSIIIEPGFILEAVYHYFFMG